MKLNTFSLNSKGVVKRLRTCVFGMVALCVLMSPSQAQERGFQPGVPYALSDIEAINAANGNMTLQIPLVALPAGRGGVPGPELKLVYNSKLYETHTESIPDPGTGQIVTQIWLNDSGEGGWHYNTNFGYQFKLISRTNLEGQYPCVANADYQKNAFIWKLMVIFPDGGEHEFRPMGYTDLYQDGYYDIDPHGTQNFASALGGSCSFTQKQATTNGMTYYSTDGTFIRLFVPYSTSEASWTMSFPGGSRLVTASGSQTMYDRNNNIIPIGLEDVLGRKITMQYNAALDEDHIVVIGANEQQLEWVVKWKTVYVSRQYTATTANNGKERGNIYTQVLTNAARVVDRITLPIQGGGLTYVFGYSASATDPYPGFSPGWGELNAITLPSGAQVNYAWAFDGSGDIRLGRPPTWDWVLNNHPVRKDLTYLQEYDGDSTPITDTWTYSGSFRIAGAFSVTGPDGGTTKTYSYPATTNSPFVNYAYRTDYPDGSVTEKVWKQNRPQGIPAIPKAVNPYVQREFHTIRDAAGVLTATAIKEYNFDKNGNPTEVREYDWVDYNSLQRDGEGNLLVPANAVLIKKTANTYHAGTPNADDSNMISNNVYHLLSAPQLRNAIKDTEVSNLTQKLARTEFSYDDSLTRGNLTQQKSWDSTKGAYSSQLSASNSVSVSTQYNQYGQPTLTTDARQIKTEIIYGLVGTKSDLYATEEKTALGAPEQRWEKRDYDFNTGLVTKVTDTDNSVSTSTQYDDLGRPILVRAAENTTVETQTSTQYFDSERRVVVRADLDKKGDGKLVSIQHYDQLGRLRLTRQLEEFSLAALTDETIGIKMQTRYLTNNPCQPTNSAQCLSDNNAVIGNYVLTSNPYRATSSVDANSESTMGWTRARADRMGRIVETQTFSGSSLPAPWAGNAATTGIVITAYDGMFTTVTDQAGKLRRSKIDALGRLIRVDEPNAANNLGSQDSPTQATSYQYDALGNLTLVTQGSQTRTFQYTSLSRLREAIMPESGTVNYEYDENGNLKSKIDPRLLPDTTRVTTNYDYDKLNRVLTRSYNDGTPNVTYTYDEGDVLNTKSKGRLTNISSSVSAYSYGEYDALGRVKTGTQTTAGQAYTMSYEYNPAGALVSQKYPSGRVVKFEYDGAGRIAGVRNNGTGNYYAGAAPTDTANRIQYSTFGATQAMKLGNSLWEHTNFNARLQPVQIGLGSNSTNSTILQLDYGYGATDNNANVRSQTITVPTVSGVTGFTATQTYTYDSLNRLATAQENNGSSWKQNFDYDRFGNRKLISGTTLPAALTPANNPIINPNNNRIDSTVLGQTNVLYDNAGSLTRDADGHTYQYDAENKMVSFDGGATSGGGASYSYDGNGQRVKKVIGGAVSTTTVFVYDIMGQLVAEYADSGSTGAGISYITSDTLGSPRVVTGSSGQVKGRHDYLPFGDELFAGTGSRTPQQNFGADNLRQKFTGYERDSETNLDYAKARYYSYEQGRFTSSDPLLASGRPNKPQSWNRYAYVLNNPLRLVDPTGLADRETLDDDPQQTHKRRPLRPAKTAEPETTQPQPRWDKTPDPTKGYWVYRTEAEREAAQRKDGEEKEKKRDAFDACKNLAETTYDTEVSEITGTPWQYVKGTWSAALPQSRDEVADTILIDVLFALGTGGNPLSVAGDAALRAGKRHYQTIKKVDEAGRRRQKAEQACWNENPEGGRLSANERLRKLRY